MLSIPCIAPSRHVTLCCTGLRYAFVVMYTFIHFLYLHTGLRVCVYIYIYIYVYIDAYVYVCLCVRRHAYGIIFLSMFCIYV